MATVAPKKKPSGKGKRKPVSNPWPDKLRRLQEKLALKDNRELAARLGVSLETIRSWRYRGNIPAQIAQNYIDELLSK